MKHNTPAQEVKSLGMLFFTFFKIGLFTFGGGYAMIALLEEEFIQRRKWLDKDEFLDMTAIAESTPDRWPSTAPPTSATSWPKFPARPRPPWPSACRPFSSSTPSRCF